LPDPLRKAAEMYAGCVSGAVQKQEYLDIVKKTGFVNVTVQKEKEIVLPDEILSAYMASDEMPAFRSKAKILSITVYGEKHADTGCCSPGCCN